MALNAIPCADMVEGEAVAAEEDYTPTLLGPHLCMGIGLHATATSNFTCLKPRA